MKFLYGSELTSSIKDVVGNAKADFAVAFWGKGAADRLGIPSKAEGSRVACDARSGACNPSVLEDLLKRKVKVVDVKGLHAKVYIGEEASSLPPPTLRRMALAKKGKMPPLRLVT